MSRCQLQSWLECRNVQWSHSSSEDPDLLGSGFCCALLALPRTCPVAGAIDELSALFGQQTGDDIVQTGQLVE